MVQGAWKKGRVGEGEIKNLNEVPKVLKVIN